jgi:hypothetical protein
MVTFTLVNFFSSTLQESLTRYEINLFCLCGTVVFFPMQLHTLTGSLEMFMQQIFALTLSQSVIKDLTPASSINLWNSLQFVLMGISVLGFLGALPEALKNNPNGAQFMGLVLFMFAEATQFVMVDTEISHVLPFVGVIVIASIQSAKIESPPLKYILEGVSLFFVNAIISSLFSVEEKSFMYVIWLASITIIVAHSSIPNSQAVSDYTTWKSARFISDFLLVYNSDAFLMISLVSFILLQEAKGLNSLCFLLVINALIDAIQRAVQYISNTDMLISLLCIMFILKLIIKTLKKE